MSVIAANSEDCMYSPEGKEPTKFAKEELSFSKFINENLFVGILSSGDYISVKYWTCDHFGLEANLFIPISEMNDGLIKEKILWLASKVLAKKDSEIIRLYLSKLEKIKDGRIEIPHDMYSEFAVQISSGQFSKTISINFYFS